MPQCNPFQLPRDLRVSVVKLLHGQKGRAVTGKSERAPDPVQANSWMVGPLPSQRKLRTDHDAWESEAC